MENPSTTTVARRVVFSGRVQGVGFRYTTVQCAQRSGVVGWVRNCPDGTVEALFQGTPQAIQTCIHLLEDHFGRYIRDIHTEDAPVNPRYTDFRIVYG